MYNEFSITGITHSLADKNIVLQTNFTLDPNSVNMSTVKVKNSSTGIIEDYTLTVKKKDIVIEFVKMPTPNIGYHVSATDIKDALERTLTNHLNQTIIYEAKDVKYKVAITKPFSGEAIKSNIIEVNVKATPEDDGPVPGYYYEIASDVAFCDPITLTSTSNTVSFEKVPTGQVFVRCRVQDVNDPTIFGEWSDSVAFIALNSQIESGGGSDNSQQGCNHPTQPEDNPIIEDLLNLHEVLQDVGPIKLERIPGNGKTSKSFYLVFDKEIDPTSVPQTIVAYRRDL